MTDIRVREFAPSDWDDMVRFYEEFYGPGYIFTKWPFFDWNFASPLRPDERSGQRVLVDGEKIIGILGCLTWPLQVCRREVLGQYNINMYADPAYRGQRLGQRLLENCAAGYQYSLTNGYNARTLSMYERMGRVYHWPMSRLVKCLKPDPVERLLVDSTSFAAMDAAAQDVARQILRRCATTPATRSILTGNLVKRFDDQWDAAWKQIRTYYGFTTWRSSDFLNWRYIDYPYSLYQCFVGQRRGEFRGLVVLRIEQTTIGPVARVIDLVAAPKDRIDLLGIAEATAREAEACFVDYIASGNLDKPAMAEVGYVELTNGYGHSLLPMDFNPIRHRNAILSLCTFLNPDDPGCIHFDQGDFYIIKGDGDQDRAN